MNINKGVGSNFFYPQGFPQKIGSDPFFKIITLGCKVNQYDSQEIRERLLEVCAREAGKNSKADIYVVNTCTVTQKADRDSLYYIRRSFRENPGALIVVTGCLAQTDAKQLKNEPGVCLVVKNQDKHKLVLRIIKQHKAMRTGISFFEGHTRAFLKIQDGCNNFCSYCKVPLVRGISQSKPLLDIISEAQQLIDNGYREIVLTGICLGSYGKDLKPTSSLMEVINNLEKIQGLWRIRLSSIEAKDVNEQLIRKISFSNKLCKHIHIPIQSGDNDILGAMHRKYTRQDYIGLVTKLRKFCPNIAITTDVLVGFPGETERHFINTLNLVKRIAPLKTHIFPFSPRPGTRANDLKNFTTVDVIKDRLARIQSAANTCALKYQKKFLLKVMPVLVEAAVNSKTNLWEGCTDNYLKVMFHSRKNVQNSLIPLRLKRLKGDKIFGILP